VVLDRYAGSWFIAYSSLRVYDGSQNVRDEEHSLEEKYAHKGKRTPWTLREFGGKTVWDWLQLLVVPLMLALITVVFTWQQDARQQRIENQRAAAERELAEQRAQDEALQAYLDQMSQLMLERKLLEAEPGDPVHTLAQARTSTVILRLDAEHNESVIRFLSDSGLAGSDESSVSLLRRIVLENATLRLVDLRSIDLSDASLIEADLSDADLRGSTLRDANLIRVNLTGALADGADLSGADLQGADLRGLTLRSANLGGANLSGARLTGAVLSGAEGITNEQLEQQAASLKGAYMPNGQTYEDWLKDKKAQGEDEKNE
jgi:Pentapeptide repeats (8 copies)